MIMSASMRKILYYENVLEFKENTNSDLQLHEVQNWKICRTCLNDADAINEVEFSSGSGSMCVLGMDGNLLHVRDMLLSTTGVEMQLGDRLPMQLCRECLSKITTLYFFKLQTERAESVLKQMLTKLDKVAKNELEKPHLPKISPGHAPDTTVNEADCSSNLEGHEEILYEQYAGIKLSSEVEAEAESESDSVLPKQEILELDDSDSDEEAFEDNAPPKTIESNDQTTEVDKFLTENEEEQLEEEEEELTIEEYILEEFQEIDKITENSQVYSINIETEEIIEDEANAKENEIIEVSKCITQINRTLKSSSGSNTKCYKSGKALLDNLACIICKKTFPLQRLLISHVHEAHPSSKAFKCRICDQMFSHLQSLSRHMQTHLPKRYKKVCNLCEKSFLRADDWRRHQRTHTGERPYVCELCQKGFKQASELKEHSNTHKPNRRFECTICGHCLQSRNGLYIHKKVHEGVKNHKCLYCEKKFITKGELRSHLNVHTKFKDTEPKTDV